LPDGIKKRQKWLLLNPNGYRKKKVINGLQDTKARGNAKTNYTRLTLDRKKVANAKHCKTNTKLVPKKNLKIPFLYIHIKMTRFV